MSRTCRVCDNEVEPDGVRCPNCFSRFDDLTRERAREYYSRWSISEPTESTYLSFEEFYEKVATVYDKCERAARARETLSYSDALENGFSEQGIYVLLTISSIEYEDGRRMLTSVVADEGDIPGQSYFQLAASLGAGASEMPEWDEDSKRSWWGAAELQRVYEVWDDAPDGP